MQTVLRETTLAYMMVAGALVMYPPATTFSHKKNNGIPLPQDVRNPPVDSWFMVNAKYLSIFGSFSRGRLLEVGKVLPGRSAVFSLAAKLPANG